MCELLGMECNVPTDIVFSFSGLALRGGLKGPHADGWGLVLYQGRAVRSFLEPSAAANSPLATFVRAIWGRHLVFAHNGTVRGARKHAIGRFRPIGDTDSEYAFCALLHMLDR